MVLYEFNQTTNQTSPHYEAHINFVGPIRLPTCAMVQTMDYDERCSYVLATEQCEDNVYIFNYFNFLYCVISPTNSFTMLVGVCILLIICGYLFLILGTTADGYFCPALQVVANIMGMSENVAGVTLLAFGNGAPDLFTSFAGLSGETRTIYSDIFGAGFFVVSVVGGSIITLVPFTVPAASCLRDISFYLLDVLFIDYCVKTEKTITLLESSMILCIYVFFLFCVIMDQYLIKRAARQYEAEGMEENLTGGGSLISQDEGVIEIKSQVSKARISINSIRDDEYGDPSKGPNYRLFPQLAETLQPFNEDDWREGGALSRFFQVLKVPITLMLSFLIPVIDYDAPRNNWCKLLNCGQVIILPMFVCVVLFGTGGIYGIPYLVYTLPISVPIATYMFIRSRTDIPPPFHKYLSCLAAVGAVFTVYGCAAEIISVLDVLGVTTYRSNSFLGCTLLAWGNSVGDLVANTALARQGYYRMGFAACLGGPLFNSLMSIGVAFTYKAIYDKESLVDIGEGTMGENCSILLIILLFVLLLTVSTTNFVLRRCIGIFMLSTYTIYLAYALLGEFEIIHTYGTDHRQDLKAEPANE